MSSSVRGLTEVVLWTSDLKRSLSFYQGLFGSRISLRRNRPMEF